MTDSELEKEFDSLANSAFDLVKKHCYMRASKRNISQEDKNEWMKLKNVFKLNQISLLKKCNKFVDSEILFNEYDLMKFYI